MTVTSSDTNVPLQVLFDRTAFLELRDRQFNVRNYGADPTGAAACDSAVANCQADAGANGGVVVWPPGSYRHVNPLQFLPGQPWVGTPGATLINIDHATNNQLSLASGTSSQSWTECYGIAFGAVQDNAGDAVHGSAAHRVLFRGCTWNDAASFRKLKGRLLMASGSATDLAFADCRLLAAGTGTALFYGGNGDLVLLDETELVLPATYTGPFIDVDNGRLDALSFYFDATAHSGSADLIELLSSGRHRIYGHFQGSGFSSGSAIKTVSGGELIEERATFDGVSPYDLAGILAQGSRLSLGAGIAIASAAPTTPCATGVQSMAIKGTPGTGTTPDFPLPTILYPDQEFWLHLYNASGSNWSTIGLTGAVPSAAGGVLNTAVKALHFRALDYDADGDWDWVLIGERG